MTDSWALGIDIGTTNVKVLVCDRQGQAIDLASIYTPVESAAGGRVTQEPRLWREALDHCFALLRSRRDLAPVRALALACQGETLVYCDAEGRELGPAISWMDTRAQVQVALLRAARGDWYARTGKTIASYSTLSKILWLREEQPELYSRARRFCQVSDFLVAWLTGRWICDVNNASFSNMFNIGRRRWDEEICHEFSLEGLLAETAESGTVAGVLHEDLARRWGLSQGVRVVLGGHDQGCAALGAAPPDESSVILSTGTAWVLYCPLPAPRPDPSEQLILYCHAQPAMWSWLAAYSGGGVLDAWIGRFCSRERDECSARGESIYDRHLVHENLADDLFVIPHLFGAQSPDYDPEDRAALLNWGPEHGPEHVSAAIAEAIAFETRRNLDVFRALGHIPQRLKMMGGAGRGAFWPQLVADVCNLTVDVLELADAAALGAAFLAGEAIGLFPNHRLPAYPATCAAVPDPGHVGRMEKKYRRYLCRLKTAREQCHE